MVTQMTVRDHDTVLGDEGLVTVAEYLRTSYRPDRELVDGRLREKPMPTRLHGFVQALIAAWFVQHMTDWNVAPETEVRTRVSPTGFRLPDVSVTAFSVDATSFRKA